VSDLFQVQLYESICDDPALIRRQSDLCFDQSLQSLLYSRRKLAKTCSCYTVYPFAVTFDKTQLWLLNKFSSITDHCWHRGHPTHQVNWTE